MIDDALFTKIAEAGARVGILAFAGLMQGATEDEIKAIIKERSSSLGTDAAHAILNRAKEEMAWVKENYPNFPKK